MVRSFWLTLFTPSCFHGMGRKPHINAWSSNHILLSTVRALLWGLQNKSAAQTVAIALSVVRKRKSNAGVSTCLMFHYQLIKIRIAFVRNVCRLSSRKQLGRLIHSRMTLDQLEMPGYQKRSRLQGFAG